MILAVVLRRVIVFFMVECPRCGFIQPDDRYCANCGLDSLAYTPKPTPLYLKILKNIVFQLSLAVIAVVVFIALLYKRQDRAVETQLTEVQARVAAALPSTAEEEKEPAKPTPERATPAVPVTLEATSFESPKAEVNETESASALPKEAKASKLQIDFYDLPIEPTTGLIESEGKLIIGSPTYRIYALGLTPRLTALLESGHKLPGGQTARMKLNDSIHLNFATQPERLQAAEPASLIFDLTPTAREPDAWTILLNGQMSLPAQGGEPPTRLRADGEVLVTNDTAIMLLGFMPHRPINRAEHPFYLNSPMAIMTRDSFTESSSEFAMILKTKD